MSIVSVRNYIISILVASLAIGFIFSLTSMSAFGIDFFVVWLLAGVSSSNFVVDSIHSLLSRARVPTPLPRLQEVSVEHAEATALVVCPILLTSDLDIDALVRRAEENYLRNADSVRAYCVLTDFEDSATQHGSGDPYLLDRLTTAFRCLNSKYGAFLVIHRDRELLYEGGPWGGYERKRGKINAFNDLVLGRETSMKVIMGDESALRGMRYIFTLDFDTGLSEGQVADLLRIMRHPEIRAKNDSATGRVVFGYGLLQPRPMQVASLHSPTRYQRLFCDDIPTTERMIVRNAFQDLFAEGSFYGKGMYDVQAFDRALCLQIPDHCLLSHDLIEGSLARCAAVMDSFVTEEFPRDLLADMRRKDRWVRGDWQSLPWACRTPPSPDASRPQAALSMLSRWKIVDNVRRSLSAISTPLLLGMAWQASHPVGAAFFAVGIISGTLFVKLFFYLSTYLRISETRRRIGRELARDTVREGIRYVFMAHDGWVCGRAAVVAVCRMLTKSRKRLQWAPTSSTHPSGPEVILYVRSMWVSVAFSGLGLVLVFLKGGNEFLAAAPLLTVWTIAPALGSWLGKSIEVAPVVLGMRNARNT